MKNADSPRAGKEALLVAVLLAAITVVLSSWFFLSMGRFTGGALSMPLDDSFIYFQYARSFAEGEPFRYSFTDEPSTGATSLLYVLILTAGYRLGARGDSIIFVAFVLGSLFLLASSLIVVKLLRMLCGGVASICAAVLFLANGHVLWAYLSGMEVGLFTTTILLTLFFFLKERPTGRFYGTSVAAGLMGLSRPEGFFLAIPVALLILVLPRDTRRWERCLLALVSLSGGIQFVLNWSLTGSPASTGTQAKSVFYAQEPDLLHFYVIRFFRLAGRVILLFLRDFNSPSFGPHWARVAALFFECGFIVSAVAFVFDRAHRNSAALLLGSWVILSVFLSLVPWAWNVHFNRYQVPFFPVFLVIASAGLGILANSTPKRARIFSQLTLALVFGLVAISFLGTTRRTALKYAHNCENIFHQQARVGRWVNLYTPSDAIVGLNDAGAIAYYGHRRVFDFVGVVTTREAISWRSGMGSVVEALERLPKEKLPRFLAIYPNWLPFLVSSGVAKTEVFRAHLDLNTICGGSDKVVYLPDWTLLGSGHSPPSVRGSKTRTLVDSLDVADLESEREHGYRVLGSWRPEVRVFSGSPDTSVMDGGRRIFVGEVMKIRCSPARALLVLLRLDGSSAPLALQVNRVLIGSATPERARDGWAYVSFVVPADLLRRQPVEMAIRLNESAQGGAYGSYHYWFFQ